MRLGISLSPALLLGRPETEAQKRMLADSGGVLGLLRYLRGAGAESIELRTVTPQTDPMEALHAAEIVWDAGMKITVHGAVRAPETAEKDILSPISEILKSGRQESVTVTFHGLSGEEETVSALRSLNEKTKHLPVKLALENNRDRPGAGYCVSPERALAALEKAEADGIGICWDWGHDGWNLETYGERQEPLSERFLRRVIHTHIHGIYEHTTHFPLRGNHKYAAQWMELLEKNGYNGLYHVELEAERFFGRFDLTWNYIDALEYLRELGGVTKDELPRIGADYAETWRRIFLEAGKTEYEGCVWQQYHAGYLFRTDGVLWGMDFYIPSKEACSAIRNVMASDLRKLRWYFLTHDHIDHFDPVVLREMEVSETVFIVPDFLLEELKKICDFPPRRLWVVHPGDSFRLGNMQVRVFESRHSTPYSIVEEYGYEITVGGKRLLFPGDVRDYSEDYLADGFHAPDVLFSHIWLGAVDGLKPKEETRFSEYIRFTDNIGAKKVFLAHLNEQNRHPYQRWTERHARWVMEELDTRDGVFSMHPGDRFRL